MHAKKTLTALTLALAAGCATGGKIQRNFDGHARIEVTAVDPVEPGHHRPVITEQPFNRILGADKVGAPGDGPLAGEVDPGQVLLGLVGRAGGREVGHGTSGRWQ